MSSPITMHRIRSWSGNGSRFSDRAFNGMTKMDSVEEMMCSSPRKCFRCEQPTTGAVMRTKTGMELFPSCVTCRDEVTNMMSRVPMEGSPPPIRKCSQCKESLRAQPAEECAKCRRISFCSDDCKRTRFALFGRQGCSHCRVELPRHLSGEIKK